MTQTIPSEMNRLKLRKLTEVSHALTYATSLDEVFRLAVDHAAELLAADKALLLVANENGDLALRASHGVDPDLADRLAERYREPLNETLVPRLAGLLDALPDQFLGVPIVVGGAIMGILVIVRRNAAHDPEHDEWLLSALADQAAVALETNRLTDLGEFREQLIGIVGHDLRNPLATVTMAAQALLLREGLGERETDLARKIARCADQANRLIDQLLDLTRSRLGGGIPVDLESTDVGSVCREVVGEMEVTHPDRPLKVSMTGGLVGVWDRDRLYQLISNLIGNAVAHGEARSVIELRIDGGETEVIIEVANQGEPIPPAMLPAIFDAFRKKQPVHPSRGGGLGLGLFISQQIVRSHGGSIAVTSSRSEGTTFRVRLPRGAV